MQDEKLISNSLVFCGPFLGEFGWELTHWMPHVRWLRNHYKNRHLIVASYSGRHPLYYGIANEFFPLPEWFLKEKYELDCFEALCPENVYGNLLKYFRAIYKSKFSEIIETRTPRGFNKILREMNHVSFDKLKASGSANKYCNDLIAKHNNKPCVILFARAVERKMVLDITNNRPLPVEALGGRLPPRNWPRSNWEDLFEMLYAKYNDKVTFVIGGTKNGNCLTNIKNKYQDIIDLTNIDKAMSLDITMAFLNKAMLSISSQSGPTHLSVQCGCTSFVYGHEQQRHSIDDNPLKTPVVFLETPADKYNDPPYILYEEIDVLMEDLLNNLYTPSMNNNLAYWKQRYSTMAKENVVGHRNWTDKEYKKELSTWNSKLRPFLDSIKKNKLKKALDFGCGIGRFMPLLSDYCDTYFGCDILDEPINEARELVKDEQRIALIENHQIPFDNTKFDLIFSSVTLQHIIDLNLLKSYINQFYKRLNPKGSVLIVENILNAPSNNYLVFRSKETYIEMFENAGFELIKEDIFESSNEPHAVLLFSKKEIKRIGIVGVFDVPGSTSIPFGKAFRKLGHEVKELNYRTIAQKYGLPRMNAEIREMSDNVDLMIFSKCNGVDIETFRKCANQTTICWHMTDAITHLKQNPDFLEYARICDFSIVTTNAMKDVLISSDVKKPVYHVLQGIDPEEFYPVEAEKKLYDFVFIGTKSPKRDEAIKIIKDLKYTVKTYGNGYEGGYVTGEAFNKACSEAKICLAINNTNSDIDSFSDRILRYMATGACVLTEYTKGLENYFEEGKEIFWFKKGEDIKAKIKEIFKNYDLKTIGSNAKKKVLANYTWDKVVQKTLSALEDRYGKV